MVLKVLKIKNKLENIIISQQYGFFNPNGSNIIRDIPPLKTRNFLCFFQPKKGYYRVIICFSAPVLRVFKIFILSGFTNNIKRFVYTYMLNHEDTRIRGWVFK
ncbi:hypothetical protein LCGC14_2933740 [marine sediment metagenome]|uniref:Uncharacterized protein n=1 Tax=marine sediment metagenome TaxID=412755 RepID=A0A0F8XK13_9ZZZZ